MMVICCPTQCCCFDVLSIMTVYSIEASVAGDKKRQPIHASVEIKPSSFSYFYGRALKSSCILSICLRLDKIALSFHQQRFHELAKTDPSVTCRCGSIYVVLYQQLIVCEIIYRRNLGRPG